MALEKSVRFRFLAGVVGGQAATSRAPWGRGFVSSIFLFAEVARGWCPWLTEYRARLGGTFSSLILTSRRQTGEFFHLFGDTGKILLAGG